MTDEKARECLKSLKNICGIQPNKAYIEYKNFLRNSEEDNLKTIEKPTVWMIKEGGYAKVERGFSLMNNITTDLRNRLKNDLLFALMLLSNYDDFEFDFEKLGVEIGSLWR